MNETLSLEDRVSIVLKYLSGKRYLGAFDDYEIGYNDALYEAHTMLEEVLECHYHEKNTQV